MQSLYKTLGELITDVSSESRFNSPANKKRIEQNAKTLSKLAHDLTTPKNDSRDHDPSIQILGNIFADEAARAYRLLQTGKPPQRAYARELLQSLPGYCIACHTRTQSGPSFTDMPLNPALKDLRSVEKGRFFAATRQFDRAIDEFSKVISEPGAATQRYSEWQEAVRNSLGIAVRMKQDPALAAKIVDQVLATKSVPFFMRQDALVWKSSIEEWQKEAARKIESEEGVYAEAVRLLAKAQQAQRFPADRGADIVYLRASAAVHRLLQFGKDAKHTNEGYLMAGLCYDVLKTYQLGELHEIYFESCIRSSPHSNLAQTCYKRYEQAIYDGFTGSAGTDIPDDIEQKLNELEVLALPASPAAPAQKQKLN
jgi:hypothetical protein